MVHADYMLWHFDVDLSWNDSVRSPTVRKGSSNKQFQPIPLIWNWMKFGKQIIADPLSYHISRVSTARN